MGRMAAVYFMVVAVIITQRSWSCARPLLPIPIRSHTLRANNRHCTKVRAAEARAQAAEERAKRAERADCTAMSMTMIRQQDIRIVQRVMVHA